MLIIESWFIPFDILMIISVIVAIILACFFLLIIILDKTCHTVSMMLIANSCLTAFLFGCSMISLSIFTFQNDLKQIQYEDSFCIFRGYFCYVSAGLFNASFMLQAIYRYITVIYPNRLFFQSIKFQIIMICLTWIFDIVYPIIFLFNGEILYNLDNQICQLPLRLSFSIIYMPSCCYLIPMFIIIIIYFKLIQYVHRMSKHVTPVNTLSRAQRELKMVQRIVIMISILLILGVPYIIFIFMSFITNPPKYHFRIAFIFIDISLAFVMIALFQFTDSLKASVKRSNMVVAAIIT